MRVNVTYMGGAAAGIMGLSDANNDIANELKKTSVNFAQEYQKKELNQTELVHLSEQIIGYLQTLQVANTLSESTAEKLIVEVERLVQSSINRT